MAKLSRDAMDLLAEMRAAIAIEYPEGLNRVWDPLIEMAVYAASPSLKPVQKFAANREIAQYIYPKKKAVEHSGEGAGITVVLAQFTQDGRLVAVQDAPLPLQGPSDAEQRDANPEHPDLQPAPAAIVHQPG